MLSVFRNSWEYTLEKPADSLLMTDAN